MALLFIEGFETYGSLTKDTLQAEVVKKWSYTNVGGSIGGVIEVGRDGGKSLRLRHFDTLRYEISMDKTVLICGFAFKGGTGPYGNTKFFQIKQAGTADIHFHLSTIVTGEIRAHLLGNTTADTTTAAGVRSGTEFIYIEVKLTIDDTTGSYEVKIDGAVALSNSGVDTDNGSDGSGVRIEFYTDTPDLIFDDIYICDNTGPQNNDFLGDCSVVALDPTSDVTTEWGTTSSPHYSEIDENPSDKDTTYIETGSPTAVDLFGFQNVTSLLGAIYGIQVCVEISDSSDPVDLRIVSGATTSDEEGVDNTVVYDPSFITYTRIVELDPNTSSAWTLSNVNAAQFGAILGS